MTLSRALLVASLLACLAAPACSAEDRPPRATLDGNGAGTGPGSGGSSGSGGSGGMAGGTAGSGGGPSSSVPPGCDRFDPSRVYLLGSLTAGEPERSVAFPESPTEVCSAIITNRPPLLDELTESVFYVNAEDGGLWAYRKDAYFRLPGSSTYQHDARPDSNDELVVEACVDGELRALIEPDTGAVWSTCDGLSYMDRNGELRALSGAQLLHLGRGGLALGIDARDELVVLNSTGDLVPTSGCTSGAPLTVRAREAGFWFVTGTGNSLALESVDDQGRCEQLGDYAALPSGTSASLQVALDGDGNVYQLGRDTANREVVIVRDYPPGAGRVVYSEENAPEGGQDWENLRFYLLVNGGDLFTGG